MWKWRRSSPGSDGSRNDDARPAVDTPPPAEQALPASPPVEAVAPATRALRAALAGADAEPNPADRAQSILSALREFLDAADAEEAFRNRGPVLSGIAEAAPAHPDAAVRLLATAVESCGADETSIRQVIREWMRCPDEASFARSWAVTDELGEREPGIRTWLIDTVRAKDTAVSSRFRRLATRHLTDLVDARFEDYKFGGAASPVWQMMYALGPSSRAGWFIVLGDHAARRGDDAEAARRYEIADRFGGAQARTRLTQLEDADAYRCLLRGDVPKERVQVTREPSAYRHLLLATSAVVHGKPTGTHLVQAVRGDTAGGIGLSAIFVTALARLRDGDPRSAGEQLRQVIDTPATAVGDRDLAANARVVLGALDGDDQLVAAGARSLHERHRDRWFTRSIIDTRTVLTAVSRCDPELLTTLTSATTSDETAPGGELENHRALAARKLLAKAARAALLSRFDEARTSLTQAGLLLGSATDAEADRLRADGTRIGELTERVASAVGTERQLDRVAFSALRRDGVIHPWTSLALRIWQEHDADAESDPSTLHHLAIAQHARAYQLELDGDEAAFTHWESALRYWARLHADARFWDALRSHLTEAMADVTAEDIALAVAEARGALPAHLLEPHVARVKQLGVQQIDRARAHVRLVRTAPFPVTDVARARSTLIRDVAVQVRRAAREEQFDSAIDTVHEWLRIDEENIYLAELAVDVGIDAVEVAHRSGAAWTEQARPVLERIATMIDPIRDILGLTTAQLANPATRRLNLTPAGDPREFAAKLARFEFWTGTRLLVSAAAHDDIDPDIRRAAFRTAATHLTVAVALRLPAAAPYDEARELLVAAQKWERVLQGRVVGFF